jgi:hypothetical protein
VAVDTRNGVADGKVIRAWFMVPPVLQPGALVLRIAPDGTVALREVESIERQSWSATELAAATPAGSATLTPNQPVADLPGDAPSTPSLLIVIEDDETRIPLPPTQRIGATPHDTNADWIVFGITAEWNRTGFMRLETNALKAPPNTPPVILSVPVPPMHPFLTAYCHGADLPWPGEWNLVALDRPGRITLYHVNLIAYFLRDNPPSRNLPHTP